MIYLVIAVPCAWRGYRSDFARTLVVKLSMHHRHHDHRGLLHQRVLPFCNLYRKVDEMGELETRLHGNIVVLFGAGPHIGRLISPLGRYSKNEALSCLPRATLPSCLSHPFLSPLPSLTCGEE